MDKRINKRGFARPGAIFHVYQETKPSKQVSAAIEHVTPTHSNASVQSTSGASSSSLLVNCGVPIRILDDDKAVASTNSTSRSSRTDVSVEYARWLDNVTYRRHSKNEKINSSTICNKSVNNFTSKSSRPAFMEYRTNRSTHSEELPRKQPSQTTSDDGKVNTNTGEEECHLPPFHSKTILLKEADGLLKIPKDTLFSKPQILSRTTKSDEMGSEESKPECQPEEEKHCIRKKSCADLTAINKIEEIGYDKTELQNHESERQRISRKRVMDFFQSIDESINIEEKPFSIEEFESTLGLRERFNEATQQNLKRAEMRSEKGQGGGNSFSSSSSCYEICESDVDGNDSDSGNENVINHNDSIITCNNWESHYAENKPIECWSKQHSYQTERSHSIEEDESNGENIKTFSKPEINLVQKCKSQLNSLGNFLYGTSKVLKKPQYTIGTVNEENKCEEGVSELMSYKSENSNPYGGNNTTKQGETLKAEKICNERIPILPLCEIEQSHHEYQITNLVEGEINLNKCERSENIYSSRIDVNKQDGGEFNSQIIGEEKQSVEINCKNDKSISKPSEDEYAENKCDESVSETERTLSVEEDSDDDADDNNTKSKKRDSNAFPDGCEYGSWSYLTGGRKSKDEISTNCYNKKRFKKEDELLKGESMSCLQEKKFNMKPLKRLQRLTSGNKRCFNFGNINKDNKLQFLPGKDDRRQFNCEEIVKSSVRVAIRFRPANSGEKNGDIFIDTVRNSVMVNTKPTFTSGVPYSNGARIEYHFDECFLPSAGQIFVYNRIAKPLIDSAFEGYNVCLFAYGQTGSGKTYSMMGDHSNNYRVLSKPGIIPLFCADLMKRIDEAEKSTRTMLEVGYYEIYNERVYDLLTPNDSSLTGNPRGTPSRVRQHPVRGPYVVGLTKTTVRSYRELKKLMDLGNKNRASAATRLNENSSRSHCVFNIRLRQSFVNKVNTGRMKGIHESYLESEINLVDLAGSERLSQTGCYSGDRFRESANINQSLMVLGKVINCLAERSRNSKKADSDMYIPYRESLLTWLLKEGLGGNSCTAMLATLHSSMEHLDETLSTLRYASNTRSIVNKIHVNENSDKDMLIMQLKEKLTTLLSGHELPKLESEVSSQNTNLKNKLAMSYKCIRTLEHYLQEEKERFKNLLYEKERLVRQVKRLEKVEKETSQQVEKETSRINELLKDTIRNSCFLFKVIADSNNNLIGFTVDDIIELMKAQAENRCDEIGKNFIEILNTIKVNEKTDRKLGLAFNFEILPGPNLQGVPSNCIRIIDKLDNTFTDISCKEFIFKWFPLVKDALSKNCGTNLWAYVDGLLWMNRHNERVEKTCKDMEAIKHFCCNKMSMLFNLHSVEMENLNGDLTTSSSSTSLTTDIDDVTALEKGEQTIKMDPSQKSTEEFNNTEAANNDSKNNIKTDYDSCKKKIVSSGNESHRSVVQRKTFLKEDVYEKVLSIKYFKDDAPGKEGEVVSNRTYKTDKVSSMIEMPYKKNYVCTDDGETVNPSKLSYAEKRNIYIDEETGESFLSDYLNQSPFEALSDFSSTEFSIYNSDSETSIRVQLKGSGGIEKNKCSTQTNVNKYLSSTAENLQNLNHKEAIDDTSSDFSYSSLPSEIVNINKSKVNESRACSFVLNNISDSVDAKCQKHACDDSDAQLSQTLSMKTENDLSAEEMVPNQSDRAVNSERILNEKYAGDNRLLQDLDQRLTHLGLNGSLMLSETGTGSVKESEKISSVTEKCSYYDFDMCGSVDVMEGSNDTFVMNSSEELSIVDHHYSVIPPTEKDDDLIKEDALPNRSAILDNYKISNEKSGDSRGEVIHLSATLQGNFTENDKTEMANISLESYIPSEKEFDSSCVIEETYSPTDQLEDCLEVSNVDRLDTTFLENDKDNLEEADTSSEISCSSSSSYEVIDYVNLDDPEIPNELTKQLDAVKADLNALSKLCHGRTPNDIFRVVQTVEDSLKTMKSEFNLPKPILRRSTQPKHVRFEK